MLKSVEQGIDLGFHDFIFDRSVFLESQDDPEFKAIFKQVQHEKAALREQVG